MKVRRSGPFWSLSPTLSPHRIELGCWVVALALTAMLAAGNMPATAGAAESIAAVRVSATTPDGLPVVSIWTPTESTGYCLKEVIESVPRWSSSRDLINAINRRCFIQPSHRAGLAQSQTRRAACLRPQSWLPEIPSRRVTGCMID
ncbi:MAG TPA: hypothetical protein VFR68_01090 [Candidatus Dormibacteraeota bacterium]|nr:hypothetical protein [Candidatus Dormibacteraeota bacterium]